jgi:creatinine amidohydrolase
MKTDYLLARALCDGVAAQLEVLIAPVIDFGYYPAFRSYPGSQHLRAETFVALLEDVLERLVEQGAAHIAIVNTGVSTEGPVQIAVRNILSRHRVEVPVADIRRLGKASEKLLEQKLGGHADEHETSLMLAIAPECVDMAKAKTDYGHMLGEPRSVFYRPVAFSGDPESGVNYSETGVRGDPTLASADKGRAIFDDMIGELVAGIETLCLRAAS